MWVSALGGRPATVRGRSDGWFGDPPGPGHKGQATAAMWVCDGGLKCQLFLGERNSPSLSLAEKGVGVPTHGPWVLKFGLDGSGVPTLTTTRKLLWGSQLVYPGTESSALSESCSQACMSLEQTFYFSSYQEKTRAQHKDPSSTFTYHQDGPKFHLPKALRRPSMIFSRASRLLIW